MSLIPLSRRATVEVQRNIYRNTFSLLVAERDARGDWAAIGLPLTMTQLDPNRIDEVAPEPTMEVRPETLQALVDELARAGFMPSAAAGSVGQLAAVQAHLAAMTETAAHWRGVAERLLAAGADRQQVQQLADRVQRMAEGLSRLQDDLAPRDLVAGTLAQGPDLATADQLQVLHQLLQDVRRDQVRQLANIQPAAWSVGGSGAMPLAGEPGHASGNAGGAAAKRQADLVAAELAAAARAVQPQLCDNSERGQQEARRLRDALDAWDALTRG